MEVSAKLQAPAAVSRGKSPRYPLGAKLGVFQSRSGRCAEENNLLPPPGIEPVPSSCYHYAYWAILASRTVL
jgi:hypothetical protein